MVSRLDADSGRSGSAGVSAWLVVRPGRQIDVKSGSLLDLALYFHPAVMLFDDAVDGGQTETGGLPFRFGGEERFKDSRQDFGRDAYARVAHAQTDKLARARLGMRQSIRGAEGNIFGRDMEAAAFRHGVARVCRQIHQQAFNHPGVRANTRQAGQRAHIHFHLLGGHDWKLVRDGVQDLAEIGGTQRHRLLAAKCQQLADEFGSLVGGGTDASQRPAVRGIGRRVREQQTRIALHDGQDVVEIVSHTGGQLTHGLQFLGLAQLAFQLDLRGNVLGDGQHERLAVQLDKLDGQQDFQQASCLGAEPARKIAHGHFPPESFQHGPFVIWIVPDPQVPRGLADQFLATVTNKTEETGIGVGKFLVQQRLNGQGNGTRLESLGKTFFRQAQEFLGLDTFGDLSLELLARGLEFLGALG